MTETAERETEGSVVAKPDRPFAEELRAYMDQRGVESLEVLHRLTYRPGASWTSGPSSATPGERAAALRTCS